MKPEVQEWLHQAEYDYEDAEYLILGERYPKAVFCCHLAVETGLKALYLHHFNNQPPPGPITWIFSFRLFPVESLRDSKI
jgi:HEPN domain-containing protein